MNKVEKHKDFYNSIYWLIHSKLSCCGILGEINKWPQSTPFSDTSWQIIYVQWIRYHLIFTRELQNLIWNFIEKINSFEFQNINNIYLLWYRMKMIALDIQQYWIYVSCVCKVSCIELPIHGDHHSSAQLQVNISICTNLFGVSRNESVHSDECVFLAMNIKVRVPNWRIFLVVERSGTYRDESAPLFVGTSLALAALAAISAYGVWR